MHKLTLLLIPLILLSSCTIDWNDEKDTKIAELEKQVQDDIFEKKQECAKYIPLIEKKIKAKEDDLNIENDYYHETINEVFYSSVKKTCIWLWNSLWIVQNRNTQEWWAIRNEYNHILDILSNDETTYDLTDSTITAKYYDEVRKLKWE